MQLDIAAFLTGHDFLGEERLNICNRGASSAGIQFELTYDLRFGPKAARFVQAVRSVLAKAAISPDR